MKANTPSHWINLHTYFKLAIKGTNGLILGLTLSLLFLRSAAFISEPVSLILYGLILFIISNQIVCIYSQDMTLRNNPPHIRQVLFHPQFIKSIQLSLCILGLVYPFYSFQNSEYYSILYSLFFVVFSPAIMSCLLSKGYLFSLLNPVLIFSFISKNILLYVSCIANIFLMGLGYKTVCYYSTLILDANYQVILSSGLAAYLFLVCAYFLSDLKTNHNTSSILDPDEKDLLELKKYIASGHFQEIHDYFKLNKLNSRSPALLDFYLKFILSIQDENKINAFGNRWIAQLFQQNNIKKAVSVCELIFKQNTYFHLSEPFINYTLAQHFMLTKQYMIVVHLLKDLSEKSPNFIHLPEALLLLAKAYLALNLEIKAKQSIDMLSRKFPQSQFYTEAQELNKIINPSPRL
jgi:hypothetical protein